MVREFRGKRYPQNESKANGGFKCEGCLIFMLDRSRAFVFSFGEWMQKYGTGKEKLCSEDEKS